MSAVIPLLKVTGISLVNRHFGSTFRDEAK
jgi:hypothetical protein